MQLARAIVQASRPHYAPTGIVSILIGTVLAWEDGSFDLSVLLLSCLALEAIRWGTSMSNEYWDFVSGADSLIVRSRYFGGSGALDQGRIGPRALLRAALASYAAGGILGIYLSATRGWLLLLVGASGGLISYFYTAPPIRLAYRGLDHVAIGLVWGPLIISGSYFVQTHRFSTEMAVVSVLVGVAYGMNLYVKQFRDVETDRQVGKESVIVKLGVERAIAWYPTFFLGGYAVVALALVIGWLPLWVGAVGGSAVFVVRANTMLNEYGRTGEIRFLYASLKRTWEAYFCIAGFFLAGYAIAAVVD